MKLFILGEINPSHAAAHELTLKSVILAKAGADIIGY
jgi:hypothetical protein